MDCRIEYQDKKYTDEEFKIYLDERGITAEQLSREKELMDRAVSLSGQVKGVYKDLLPAEPRDVIMEVARQANSSASEKSGVTKTFGAEIVAIAQELYPNIKPHDGFLQVAGDSPKFSPATIAKIKEFNDRIGVKTELVNAIVVGGKKLNANGVAYPYKGLIEIVNGKTDVALPEESMHIAVEILQQKDQGLFNDLMKDVNNHPEMNEVFTSYAGNRLYQTADGKPDVIKLKKEAIAKVLAKVVGGHVDETDRPATIAKTRTLWQRIVDFLKRLFGKAAFDPFEKVAKKVVEGEDIGNVEDLEGDQESAFLQKHDELHDKIEEINSKVSKKGGDYEVNGQKVTQSVDEDVRRDLEKKFRSANEFQNTLSEWRKETEGKLVNEMANLANRYIDDAGLIRGEYNDSPLTSVIDPYDSTFIDTLDGWFRDKVESYPPGTRFLINKSLYNSVQNKAGFANFIAIIPVEGGGQKVDINQFKLITPGKKMTDIDRRLQSVYNVEIQGLKDILKGAYAVGESDFRETRAIPVKATYGVDDDGKFDLTNLKIGNVDVKLEKDLSVLPVPSLTESTGDNRLDALIRRFRASAEQLANQKAPEGEEKAYKQRLAELFAAVRQLQVQKQATVLFKSARNITNFEESRFPDLQKKIQDTDAIIAGEEGLNKLAREVKISINRLAPYVDIGSTIRKIYGATHEYTKEAKEISDKAKHTTDDLHELQNYLRTDKFAKVSGVDDELKPEKNLTFIRRNLLGLSHGVIKSQGHLWHLVEYTSNRYHHRYSLLINKIKELKGAIDKAGITPDALNKKIFAYDDKGRRTGDVIQKIDKSFFTTVNQALKKKDLATVKRSIDLDEYNKWYEAKWASVKEYADYYDWGGTPEEAANSKKFYLQNWKDTHDLSKATAATRANEAVFRFPKKDGTWDSAGFKELKKPENKTILDLYEFWQTLTERASTAGMFEEYRDRYGFFPDIPKEMLERASTKEGLQQGLLQPWYGITTRPNDEIFGEFDPVTNTPINRVHGNYMRDLGRRVQDTDGTYFKDYSHVSDDLIKSIYLFAGDLVKFELKVATEGLAQLILDTEAMKPTMQGKTKGGDIQTIPNTINVDSIRKYIDYYWYGKLIEGEDFTFDMNVGKFVRAFNTALGFTGIKLFVEPTHDIQTFSATKIMNALTRYFRTKTLGANPLSAVSNWFGGSANAFINAGDYFTKLDLTKAFARLSMTNSWGDKEGHIRAGLLHFFQPELNDQQRANARKFSVYPAVKYLTSDYLYAMMRGSDELVNKTVALAFFDNTIVKDGKLINITSDVRAKHHWVERYSLPPKERDALEKKVAKEIEDLKANSPDLLIKQAVLDDQGVITIPQLDEREYARYRQVILQGSKEMLGNTSTEDLALYHMNAVFTNFMTFKSWIPDLLYKRLGPLEYNFGTKKHGYGRTRALVNSIAHYGLTSVGGILKSLTGDKETFVKMAEKEFNRKKQKAADKGEEFNINLGQFTDLYVKGIMTAWKEVAMALGLLGMYFYIKSIAQEDKETDHIQAGLYKYTLRGIDKLQDEISFFYNPTSFTSIVNGNVFPAIALATDAQKLLTNVVKYGWDEFRGNDAAAQKLHFMKYIYKDLPVTKEWVNFQAIFSADFAKENGIILQTQSGGH